MFFKVMFTYAWHYKAHHREWLATVHTDKPKTFSNDCELPDFEKNQRVLSAVNDPFASDSGSEDAPVVPPSEPRSGSS